MDSWTDYLSLALVLALLGGLGAVAIALRQSFNNFLQASQDLLQKHGLYITSHGVTVRMNKTYDHEMYLDDTRKALINIIRASSFGTPENKRPLADLVTFTEVPCVKKSTPLPAQ